MPGKGKHHSDSSSGRLTTTKRAGIIFPAVRYQNKLRAYTHNTKTRVGVAAGIYCAAVIEYLVAELTELAGNAARDHKKKRITERHIMLAVGHDEELSKLLRHVVIARGGVLPNINEALLPKKTPTRQKPAVRQKVEVEYDDSDDEEAEAQVGRAKVNDDGYGTGRKSELKGSASGSGAHKVKSSKKAGDVKPVMSNVVDGDSEEEGHFAYRRADEVAEGDDTSDEEDDEDESQNI